MQISTIDTTPLSGSTNGKQILVTGTSTAALTDIHQAVTGTTNVDEIYITASNSDVSDIVLTVLWGGTTEPNDAIKVKIPAQAGKIIVVGGEVLQNGLWVKAYAAIANKISIGGYVNPKTRA